MKPKHQTVDTFYSRVSMTGECWEWQGARSTGGYGYVRVGGKHMRAHRAAWEFAFGPIPAALCVLHRCDNRVCVKPDHLFLGTPGDNATDMVLKGRSLAGGRHPMAKLALIDVKSIRRRRENGEPLKLIASAFNVTKANISLICRRESWSHA